MPKATFRKKVTIEAEQWFPNLDVEGVELVLELNGAIFSVPTPIVRTLEGPVHIRPGYWIATGSDGEHWPIDPEIFAKTYEKVE